ncbi:MAG TPA: DUF1800 family protein [Methylocystis sp.]|nr:DUF1800 family protein [Methylocystis sp.]
MAIGPDPLGAVRALNRFGLGARPGDLAQAAADPRGFVLDELQRPDQATLAAAGLPTSAQALQQVYLDGQQKKMARERAAMSPPAPAAMTPDGKPAPQPKAEPAPEQKIFQAEALARFNKQLGASCGFVERLVAFWSNHFAVSVSKSGHLRAVAGAMEREAIRPHVGGRFADLLLAVETHPAMILYLDNQRSVGANAPAGRFAGRGLNENLAREILELHTLGVDGGYTQADVTEFAKVITGWSIAEAESEIGQPGSFVFKANWHEPGPRVVLGKAYAQTGRDQGEAALADLARHPATARHVAFKLARHFVSDNPPPGLVDSLARRFQDSNGDLKAVATALVRDERAWAGEATKVRTPLELVVAGARAIGFSPQEPGPFLHALAMLGMPLWQPGGPNGFPDTVAAWASPEAMKMRLDLSAQMAQRARDADEPLALLEAVCGQTASRETRQAIERAESKKQALALLFMAPEFQRR